LKIGYHQVCIKEEDTWKATFMMKKGLCEWLIMPFGLSNTPTTFMHLMNDVLHPFLDSFVIVYLDNILIFNSTWEEHVEHMNQVLETLMKHHLLKNINKCEFAKQSLVYLGHVIGGSELKIEVRIFCGRYPICKKFPSIILGYCSSTSCYYSQW
jgi:hypothetical protein